MPAGFRPPGKDETQALFTGLAGTSYSRRAALLSLGQEPRWHDALVAALGRVHELEVLDVATGTGAVAERLLARGARVTGVDQSADMLAAARARLGDDGGRLRLVEAEAERLPFADASFDALTVTYLWRYVDDPAAVLSELARVVRPGGVVAGMEFGIPPNPFWRGAWRLYTGIALPTAGMIVGGRGWYRAGRFLHRSIPDLYARHPLPALVALHRAAGLREVGVRRLSLGGGIVIRGVRTG